MFSRAAEQCSYACGLLALVIVITWLVVYALRPMRRVGRLGTLVTLIVVILIVVALGLAIASYATFPADVPRLYLLRDWLFRTLPVVATLAIGRWVVARSLRTFYIRLQNEGPHTIASARVEAPGAHVQFDEIKPGESASRHFMLVAAGSIDLMIAVDEQIHEHRITDQANRLQGEHYLATLKGDVMTVDRVER